MPVLGARETRKQIPQVPLETAHVTGNPRITNATQISTQLLHYRLCPRQVQLCEAESRYKYTPTFSEKRTVHHAFPAVEVDGRLAFI